MEPIREAEMQTQPGKRLNEESKKSGKGPLLIAGIVLAVLLAAYVGLCACPTVRPPTSMPLMWRLG